MGCYLDTARDVAPEPARGSGVVLGADCHYRHRTPHFSRGVAGPPCNSNGEDLVGLGNAGLVLHRFQFRADVSQLLDKAPLGGDAGADI